MKTDEEIIGFILEELYYRRGEHSTQIKLGILNRNNIKLEKPHFEVIIMKLMNTSLVEEHESITAEDYSFSLNVDGINIIHKHGSYSAYLDSVNDKIIKENQEKKSEIKRKNLTLIASIIFGLSTLILGWINFGMNDKIQEKDIQILRLTNSLDSSQNEIIKLKRKIKDQNKK